VTSQKGEKNSPTPRTVTPAIQQKNRKRAPRMRARGNEGTLRTRRKRKEASLHNEVRGIAKGRETMRADVRSGRGNLGIISKTIPRDPRSDLSPNRRESWFGGSKRSALRPDTSRRAAEVTSKDEEEGSRKKNTSSL